MANAIITAWEQDPANGDAADGGVLIHRPVPDTTAAPFPTRITTQAPPADTYGVGTAAFRYWACADALRRTSDFWGGLMGEMPWNPAVGAELAVVLDEGEDLNAFYDRRALRFFHAPIHGRMVYSGESPDVISHEMGHAILDAIRPELWDVAAFEPPAFHESMGDIVAITTALQLPSVRQAALHETQTHLYRSSRLSRLAEQLGWAIRQRRPDAVDRDSLRNAVNSLFYKNPDQLPSFAPSDQLSSEPHSLSRVFTGGYFESLALMFASTNAPTEDALQAVSVDLAKILLFAIRRTPVVPEYFSQLAAHMIARAGMDSAKYAAAIRTAMVKHGIVSVPGAVSVAGTPPAAFAVAAAGAPGAIELDVSAYGLVVSKVRVIAADETKKFGIAGAAPSIGDTSSTASAICALGFFEDLIRRGRLDYATFADPAHAVLAPVNTFKTHKLESDGDSAMLRRARIDCGLRTLPARP